MKVYTREEAITKSKEYFNGDDLAAEVFVTKYAMRNDKGEIVESNPDQMHRRLAKEFARIESKYPNVLLEEEIYNLFKDFKFIVPQGSPMFGIGNPYQKSSLSNCFVIDLVDSYGGICRADERIAQISKRRGGCVEHNSFVNIENKSIMKIKDINVGDKILSYNIYTKKSEYQEVQDKYYTDVKKENQVKIILKNGFEIRTSKTHPVLILKDDQYVYKKAAELKKEDICVIPEKNDIVLEHLLKYDKNLVDIGWFIGAHTGDGTLGKINKSWNKNLPKGLRIRILGDNENVVKEYSQICNGLTGSNSEYSIVTNKKYKSKVWHYVNVCNSLVGLASKYLDNKIGRKTYDCEVFSFIEKENLWIPYIAGLIDTDGHVRKDGKIDLSMCAKGVILKIGTLLSSVGFKIHIKKRISVFKNEKDIYRMTIPDIDFAELILPYLRHEKKINRINAVLNKKRKFSRSYYITEEEKNSILNKYTREKYNRKSEKNKKRYNMIAIIGLLKKNNRLGLGGLEVFKDYGFISDDKEKEIMQRIEIEKIAEEEENLQYIDLSVKNNNNYYAGSKGLINIHNCGLDISPIRPKGLPTRNSALSTDGIVVFMERFSNTSREVAQCIDKDQRVLTKTGLKRIEDIIPNSDYVWTKVGWVRVLGKTKNKKQVYKVISEAGYEIKTSIDHVFMTYDGEELIEKKLSEIEEGDTIILLCGNENINKDYIRLLQYQYDNSNNKPNNCVLPEILDEDLAYLIGYSYGDGYVERNKYNEPRMMGLACAHKYPEIQSKLEKIVIDKFGYTPTIKYRKDEAVNSLQIHNKCLIDFLDKNKILKEKSQNIVFPSIIIDSPVSVLSAFISGYFDADGYSSGKKGGYRFTSINLNFLKCVQSALLSMGMLSKISFEDRSDFGWNTLYLLSVVGGYSKKIFKRLMNSSYKVFNTTHEGKRDNWLTSYISRDLGVSHNKYNFIPDNSQNISVMAYNKLSKEIKLNEGILIQDKVASIEEDIVTDTYDLQLEDEHLFWCEGFYVHNSGRRGALMISISVHHPEVMNFITAKRNLQKITGANISVRVSDEFMNAVKKNTNYEQRWPVDSDKPVIKQSVKAREIWDELVKSNYISAEPGILFWDNIIRNSPADSYAQDGYGTTSTNPSLRWNTLILTSGGVYPIKWLAENKNSYCVRNVRGEWHSCNVFKSGENKELYKITFTNNQSVYCTAEHKWPILNSSGNIINPQTGKVLKRATIDLKRQQKIYLPYSDNPINNSECKFSRLDGFILGWNQGDGWICEHSGLNNVRQYGFIFGQEDMDSGIGQKVLNYTNKMAKIDSTLGRDHDSASFSYTTTDKNVRDRMQELGACYKKEGIPNTVWRGNSEFIKGYIDGLFSADSYVGIKDDLSDCRILVSAHKKLVEDCQKLLSFYGIKSNIKKSIATPMFPKYNSGKEYTRYDLYIGTIHVKKFAEIFSLSNKSKQSKLNLIKKKETLYNKNPNRKAFANNRDYLVVKSVEKTDIREDVYDITVHDDTHTFLMETGITGNCGELPLGNGSSCILLLQNLTSYVKNPFGDKPEFDEELFKKNTRVAQKLIDDMVDLEIEAVDGIIEKITNDPESDDVKYNELTLWKHVKDVCTKIRRTGLGITGLGDCIAMLNIKYGSNESLLIVEKIYSILRNEAYRSSIELAKERGVFPVWDYKKEKDNEFLNRLPDDIKNDMKKHGRRNVACLTTSPAGSVSTQTRTTSGFEPVYLAEYVRRRKLTDNDKDKPDFVDDSGDKWKQYTIEHHGLKKFKEITGKEFKDSPYFGAQAGDINFEQRIKMQAIATQYTCHAISSTVNLPHDVPIETVDKLYRLAWEKGCKGLTVYRDGSRDGVLVKGNNIGKKCDDCDDASQKLRELIQQGQRPTKIILSPAPKRQSVLPCEIHRSKVGKGDWLFFVGIHEGQPYEVFGGNSRKFTIPFKYKNGWILKNGKNKSGLTQYHLILGSLEDQNEKLEFKDINNHFNNREYGAFTRLVSLSLRHGTPIRYICEQITKTGCAGDFFSFQRAMSRILKKYIADGEKSEAECPVCKSPDVYYKNGCPTCKICGHSNCS